MRISVYNQITHIHALTLDLQRAKLIVIIVSPFLAEKNIERWTPELKALIERGVIVDVVVDLPKHYYGKHPIQHKEEENEVLRKCVAMLEAIGVHVNLVPNVHNKLVIIDYRWLWDGSLNFLSSNPKSNISERANRYDDVIHTMAAYAHHNLERCNTCETKAKKDFEGLLLLSVQPDPADPDMAYPTPEWRSKGKISYSLDSSNLIEKSQGEHVAPGKLYSWLLHKRIELFNVGDMADAIKVSRSALSEVEAGRSIPSLETLAKFANKLGWELILIPHPLVPLVDYIVRSYHRSDVAKLIPRPTLNKKKIGRPPRKSTAVAASTDETPKIEKQKIDSSNFAPEVSKNEVSEKDSTDKFNLPPTGQSGIPSGSL